MTMMAEQQGLVFGGVDTHAEVHAAAVVDLAGRVLGTAEFAVTEQGYGELLEWMRGFGDLARAGLEGTGSYGAGLSVHLAGEGVTVLEVMRPDRQRRRQHGKSDPVDAVSAALSALRAEDCATPKSRDGAAESIRALRAARAGAVKARTQAANQLHALVITAPAGLRTELQALSAAARVRAAAGFTGGDAADPAAGTRAAMASIARRWLDLDAEAAGLDTILQDLVAQAATPQFLAMQGVGTQCAAALIAAAGDNPDRITTEAGFAALCGASPVDCSSGKHARHRLNRGGDRQANSALWRIVQTRLQHDPRTQAYLERRTKDGKTRKEIIRCLKRYIAREIYNKLIRPQNTSPAPQPANP